MDDGAPLTDGSRNQNGAQISAVRFDGDRHVRSIVSAEARSSLTPTTALSPPERRESPSVPTDHGFGLDNDERRSPALLDAAEENQDDAVAVSQLWALPATVQGLESAPQGIGHSASLPQLEEAS